ncbi:MAG: pyrroline-5-carboxylate reductase [Gammaproteobacteria bacterium]|nr:pyrroline-5-carboxylate reductase [Gammaproteobacteria bacterium]
MDRNKVGFIGGGNMARAIAGGLVRSGFEPAHILISEPAAKQRRLLRKEFDGSVITKSNAEVAEAAGNLVLAVKPQILGAVCRELQPVVQSHMPVVISIAAGARVADIDTWLGGGLEIVRVMPNQPALIDMGISALYANETADEFGRILAEKIMSAVGQVVWLEEESLMDAVTAVSGTGPAYFYLLIDAMIESAVRLGIGHDSARALVLQTARGATALASAEHEPMSVLIDRVRSPGGTTAAAFEHLESLDVRGIFATAIKAARDRSVSLADEAGAD